MSKLVLDELLEVLRQEVVLVKDCLAAWDEVLSQATAEDPAFADALRALAGHVEAAGDTCRILGLPWLAASCAHVAGALLAAVPHAQERARVHAWLAAWLNAFLHYLAAPREQGRVTALAELTIAPEAPTRMRAIERPSKHPHEPAREACPPRDEPRPVPSYPAGALQADPNAEAT